MASFSATVLHDIAEMSAGFQASRHTRCEPPPILKLRRRGCMPRQSYATPAGSEAYASRQSWYATPAAAIAATIASQPAPAPRYALHEMRNVNIIHFLPPFHWLRCHYASFHFRLIR